MWVSTIFFFSRKIAIYLWPKSITPFGSCCLTCMHGQTLSNSTVQGRVRQQLVRCDVMSVTDSAWWSNLCTGLIRSGLIHDTVLVVNYPWSVSPQKRCRVKTSSFVIIAVINMIRGFIDLLRSSLSDAVLKLNSRIGLISQSLSNIMNSECNWFCNFACRFSSFGPGRARENADKNDAPYIFIQI